RPEETMGTLVILLPPLVVLGTAALLAVLFGALLRRRPRWLRLPAALLLGVAGALLAAWLAADSLPDGWLPAEPRRRVDEADVFLVFALGLVEAPEGGEAGGQTNLALAHWLVRCNAAKKPAIVQEGVYLALKELEAAEPTLAIDSWVIRLPHDPQVYVDT